MELSSSKNKKFQNRTSGAQKIKKNTLKKLLILREMKLPSHKIRSVLIFQEVTFQTRKHKNFLYYSKSSSHIPASMLIKP